MKNKSKLLTRVFSSAVLVTILACQIMSTGLAYAAQITNRSLTLQAGATDGGSKPGGVVNHLFNFTIPGGTSVGSIKFEYCTLAAGVPDPNTCITPTGLVTTSAALGEETGATGFVTMVNATNGAPYIARASASSIGANTVASYQLTSITNPTAANQTFYVRVSTYASLDATGEKIDAGTVAASTANQIKIDGIMPESLVFCAGEAIGVNGSNVPDCATATPGAIIFNQLFSSTDTATARSQMAASTNAGSGYVITVNGPTLTSGSNTVAAMGTTTAGVHGVSQFGLNLKANTTATSTTAVGLEIATPSNGLNYRGQAVTGYNVVDQFKFTSGDAVANSANGGAGGTDAQIYTVSYIVNVPGSQPAGTYTSTLTYICTPTF